MIIGILGTICAGKKTLIEYLVETYGFEAVNLQTIFKKMLENKFNEMRFQKSYIAALAS